VSSAAEAAVIVTAVLCGGTIESTVTGEGYDAIGQIETETAVQDTSDMQMAV